MRNIYILIFSLICLIGKSQFTYTWTNLDGDFDFDNANNWDCGFGPGFGVPTFADNAFFNATNTDVCNMPSNTQVVSLMLLSGYTGTVDASSIDLTMVNFNVQAGTFISPSGSLHVSGNMTKGAGGTFNANSGVVHIDLQSASARNINGAFNFAVVSLTASSSAGNRVMNFGTTGTSSCTTLELNCGTYPLALRGIMNVSAGLNITGTSTVITTSTLSSSQNTGTILFVGGGAKTIVGTASAMQNPIPNVSFNTTGSVAMSGHITISRTSAGAETGGTWNVTNIGSFIPGTSTVTMKGGTITAGTTSASEASFDHLSILTGSTVSFAGNSWVNVRGDLVNNGIITPNTSLLRLTNTTAQSIGPATTTLNALEITNSGTKTLGGSVIILDSVKVNAGTLASGGNLRLRSTSSLKGRVAEITGGGSISGNAIVETFMLGGTTDWANLGVSGVTGQTFGSWYGPIPMAIEGSSTGVTSVGGNYFESVQSWTEFDGYGYDTTITLGSPITVSKGYWVYLGDNFGTTGNITTAVTGALVQGNQPILLTRTPAGANPGYNLIANPYASPISWTKLRNGNASVANAIYIYNADIGATTSFVNGVSSHGVGVGAQDDIPMGQAFYCEALATTVITAQESNKNSNNTNADQLLKSANVNQSPNQTFWLKLEGANDYDMTAINFIDGASDNFDPEVDAHKIYSSPGYIGFPGQWNKRTAIASQIGNEEYSINSVQRLNNQSTVIDIITRPYLSGNFSISAENIENIAYGTCMMLKDKATNTTHDLRSGPYSFYLSDTTYTARFELTVCGVNAVANVNNQVISEESITIGQDKIAAYVNLAFPAQTEALISVYNILGQKIIKDKKVVTTKETVRLDLPSNNEILIISVKTNDRTVTKKLVR
ncbi:MAG: hypothetical protein IPM51_12855 [Sphingobacteriaceae bacterium]|nr:hypothetical protein [Sphingobacteriaceae bacterium]